MNPALVAVSVLDVKPVAFMLIDLERDAFVNLKQYLKIGAGAGTNVAFFLIGDNRRRFVNQ